MKARLATAIGRCRVDGNNQYAVRSQRIEGQSKSFMMHREVMNNPEHLVDHEDQNGLNNQKYNLREATKSQNCKNRRAHGVSKFLGVDYKSGKWQARIQTGVNKKRITLGRFLSEDRAAVAYNIAAAKYHGEFAKFNQVEL